MKPSPRGCGWISIELPSLGWSRAYLYVALLLRIDSTYVQKGCPRKAFYEFTTVPVSQVKGFTLCLVD